MIFNVQIRVKNWREGFTVMLVFEVSFANLLQKEKVVENGRVYIVRVRDGVGVYISTATPEFAVGMTRKCFYYLYIPNVVYLQIYFE